VLAMATPLGRRLRAAIAISPQDVAALGGRRAGRAHDVLFLSDHREAPTARALARGAARSRVAESELLGHGVALLAAETNRRLVLDWLARLRTPGG
jgi:hypothetical protein